MNCESSRKMFSLFLYGELGFEEEELLEQHLKECRPCREELEREKQLHAALKSQKLAVPAELMDRCRRDLHFRLAGSAPQEQPKRSLWAGMRWRVLRPAGALALVALGFFTARVTMPGGSPPVASRIRYIQPGASGRVQIVLDETRQRVLTGRGDQEPIRGLLLTAARDPDDPGLRVETMDLLKTQSASSEVRNALLNAVLHDPNAGVRLKALEGLKSYASQPESRQALIQVLRADENPGIRTQAIDLLIEHRDDSLVRPLQELLRRESDTYIRSRCQNALREMKASVETF